MAHYLPLSTGQLPQCNLPPPTPDAFKAGFALHTARFLLNLTSKIHWEKMFSMNLDCLQNRRISFHLNPIQSTTPYPTPPSPTYPSVCSTYEVLNVSFILLLVHSIG